MMMHGLANPKKREKNYFTFITEKYAPEILTLLDY
jgi:hypothetical protein